MRLRLRHPFLALSLPAILLIAACSSGGGGEARSEPTAADGHAAITAQPPPTAAVNVRPGGPDLTTTELVRLAEPTVVRIETSSGVGSGVVVSSDGLIVTNNHVVAGFGSSSQVLVTLSDGTEERASIVGTDPRSDLAVLRIDRQNLSFLTLADLSDVAVGQDVVAIGFALDLPGGEGPSFSVTRGIVSAKNRGINETATILGAIQTDAAITHGNSGGPLLNMRGQVVGINTALAPDRTTGGVASGIGFAVGSDTVRAVFEQIRDRGRVDRGLLGILNFEGLRPADARRLGIPETQGGVYLDSDGDVASGGPAAQAGLRGGDVIIKVGESSIRNESDLAVAMIRHHPGEEVPIELYRGGDRIVLEVNLGTPAQ